ncbi:MAG TPA: PEP-CTERM sorting domain-containing protein [Terriglobia bacterium]|nr:PEP-CTERM sorting domain-containing protein [Terriglobia bacterium]
MRRLLLTMVAAAMVLGLGASAAKADSINFVRARMSFGYDDFQPWNALGVNNFNVTNGSTATSAGGLVTTTIDFGLGGPGSTLLECPGSSCTWNGNFSPQSSLLASFNENTLKGEGAITLDFSQGVSGVGFQIQGNYYGTFDAEIEAFNGANPLGTFYAFDGNSNGNNDNSAIFLGLQDLSGANITSIQVLAYDCSGNGGGDCNGFAINRLLFETSSPTTPEPASLLLLGSGLGAVGFLRRKLFR